MLYNPVPEGTLTDGFGPRGWVPGLGDLGTHTGQDIKDEPGTPILAAHDGAVKSVWWDSFVDGTPAGGWMVSVQGDDGYETRYAHMLTQCPLPVGTRVTGGLSTLGLVGSTGAATGPHLHFETLRYGAYVDPLPLITKESRMSLTASQKTQLAAAARDAAASKSALDRLYKIVTKPTKRNVDGKPLEYSQGQNATDTNSLARELLIEQHITRAQLDALCVKAGIDPITVAAKGRLTGLTRLSKLLGKRASTPPKA